MPEPIVVGYWRTKENSEERLPWPVPNELSQEQAETIYKLILKKEKNASVISYRGFSRSRITNERLGSREYKTSKFVWPEDFAKHYVLEHKVKPPKNFLDWIGYKEIKKEIKYFQYDSIGKMNISEMKSYLTELESLVGTTVEDYNGFYTKKYNNNPLTVQDVQFVLTKELLDMSYFDTVCVEEYGYTPYAKCYFYMARPLFQFEIEQEQERQIALKNMNDEHDRNEYERLKKKFGI